MQKSLLVCLAHPDDEIGVGPLVTRYVAEGARATLICATNGDVGTVDKQYLEGYESIAALRLAELDCATKTIGFTEVITWGYRDSGMMGTEDNQHAASFWQAPLEQVTEQVAEVMRRVQPQVVITFNTYGAYGHPDHIKCNQATLAAFQQLQSEPAHPRKLYYTSGPRQLMRVGLAAMRLLRKDPRKAGRNNDVDFQAAYEAITPTTTRIPVAGYAAPTLHAMRCHASQMGRSAFRERFGPPAARLLWRHSGLSRVIPAPQPGERIERDLFE
jgi:N-acetyl-1-D-myo-inositol-2-amino-2-deoxy-alpha-D-glucopyranoside deacetylase/mycothiol S-conjugate amidase